MNQKLLFIRKYNCIKSQKQNCGIIIQEKNRRVLIGKGCQNFAQGLKPSDNGGEELEHNEKRGGRNKTAVNDQRNFAPRLKEVVSEDRRFKPKHQTTSDEPKTAIHQEVQLHQKSEAEPWNHHLRKKRSIPIGKDCQNFAQELIPSDNGGKEVEHNEERGGRNKNCCK